LTKCTVLKKKKSRRLFTVCCDFEIFVRKYEVDIPIRQLEIQIIRVGTLNRILYGTRIESENMPTLLVGCHFESCRGINNQTYLRDV